MGAEPAPAPATRLLVLLGSVTPPSRLLRALREALDRADAVAGVGDGGVESRLIDLADVRVSFAGSGDPSELADDTAAVIAAVSTADVVVFATPVYRGSMSGALKNVFDLLPVPALQGKVVALAAMGASDHHFLGPDRHLRDVLTFFGALVTPVSAYLTGADFPDGAPGERAGKLLDELIQGALSLAVATAHAGSLAPSSLGARAVRR